MRCDECGCVYDDRLYLCPACHESNPRHDKPLATRLTSAVPATAPTERMKPTATIAGRARPETAGPAGGHTNPPAPTQAKLTGGHAAAQKPAPPRPGATRRAICHLCHESIDLSELRQHLATMHSPEPPAPDTPPTPQTGDTRKTRSISVTTKKPPTKAVTTCPHCRRRVMQSNLKRHLKRVHPAELALADLDLASISMQLNRFIHDPTIQSLLHSAVIEEEWTVLRQTARTVRSYRRAVTQLAKERKSDPELTVRALAILDTIQAAFRSGLFTDKQRRLHYSGPIEYEELRVGVYSGGLPGSGKR